MSRARRRWAGPSGAAVFLIRLCLARPATACPVCFGNDNSPLTHGARAAALVLLGVTALVLLGLGALAAQFYWRRGRLVSEAPVGPVAEPR